MGAIARIVAHQSLAGTKPHYPGFALAHAAYARNRQSVPGGPGTKVPPIEPRHAAAGGKPHRARAVLPQLPHVVIGQSFGVGPMLPAAFLEWAEVKVHPRDHFVLRDRQRAGNVGGNVTTRNMGAQGVVAGWQVNETEATALIGEGGHDGGSLAVVDQHAGGDNLAGSPVRRPPKLASVEALFMNVVNLQRVVAAGELQPHRFFAPGFRLPGINHQLAINENATGVLHPQDQLNSPGLIKAEFARPTRVKIAIAFTAAERGAAVHTWKIEGRLRAHGSRPRVGRQFREALRFNVQLKIFTEQAGR